MSNYKKPPKPLEGYIPLKKLPIQVGHQVKILPGMTVFLQRGKRFEKTIAKNRRLIRVTAINPGVTEKTVTTVTSKDLRTTTDIPVVKHILNPMLAWVGGAGRTYWVDINEVVFKVGYKKPPTEVPIFATRVEGVEHEWTFYQSEWYHRAKTVRANNDPNTWKYHHSLRFTLWEKSKPPAVPVVLSPKLAKMDIARATKKPKA